MGFSSSIGKISTTYPLTPNSPVLLTKVSLEYPNLKSFFERLLGSIVSPTFKLIIEL